MDKSNVKEILNSIKDVSDKEETEFEKYIRDYIEKYKNRLRKQIDELEKELNNKEIDLSAIPPPSPYCSVPYFCQCYSSKDGDI